MKSVPYETSRESDDLALLVSDSATCHDTMRSPSQTISAAKSRVSHTPSTKRTRQASPVGFGMGQTPQNLALPLQKVLLRLGIETRVSFDMSYARNSPSLVAVSS